MGRAANVVREFARATGGVTRRSHTLTAAGMARWEAEHRHGPLRVTLRSTWRRVEAEIRGVETPLLFSVNGDDFAFLLNLPLDEPVGCRGLTAYVRREDDPAPVTHWLARGESVKLIDALELGPRERLFVCSNAVQLVGAAKRDWPAAIETLITLTDSLPRQPVRDDDLPVVDGMPFDSDTLPADLQPLADAVVRWAVGDDDERARRLRDATPVEQHNLAYLVSPLLPRINDYLDSFGDATLPDEAVLLGRLAEAASELGV